MTRSMTRLARSIAFAAVIVAGPAFAQTTQIESLIRPTLRASVVVGADIVRIGDLIDNAGAAADVAIFRAPDPGTTGTVPAAQIVDAVRAHGVIGIERQGLQEITVSRASRTIAHKDIEQRIARALAGRGGLGEAKGLTIRFDGDVRPLHFDAASGAELELAHASYNPQTARFDATFAVQGRDASPIRLRYTGTVAEFVDITVLTRPMERGDVLRQSDLGVEQRPKAEVRADHVTLERALGMSLRRAMRTGQPLRDSDLAKPELVQRNQSVVIVYETPAVHLTIRGIADQSGSEGDVVSVTNRQSKRTVQGVVTGPGQITISPAGHRVASASSTVVHTAAAATRGKFE